MPRLRNVLLTAALAAMVLSVWMALHGCDDKQDQPDIRRQLAAEQRRREAAESRATAWQISATVLGAAAVLALVAGTALGSRARRDSGGNSPHGPRK